MAIDSKHPEYTAHYEQWLKLEHCHEGEEAVKRQGTRYLPATQGMNDEGMSSSTQRGRQLYDAYLARAVFPELVSEAVTQLVGLMHRKSPTITVPKAMEPLLERVTREGESAAQLLRRINEQQLIYGRTGLLVDIIPGPSNSLPYVALYTAGRILNWDSGAPARGPARMSFVVLDQSGQRLGPDFSWANKTEHLVVQQPLEGGPVEFNVYGEGETAVSVAEPALGGRKFEQVPFVFVNTNDLSPQVAKPPLLYLANLCLAIYRLQADYRQSLYMQGQDTLVVSGGALEEQYKVGAGNAIVLSDPSASAKFIGVSSSGLAEQRQAVEADMAEAAELGGRLLRARGAAAESGEALQTRVAARATTLIGIARTAAAGLEQALRFCAQVMGLNPADVTVVPNLDFIEDMMTGREVLDLITARSMGAPLSLKTIHEIMKRRELTALDFEEEMDLIAEEDAPRGTAPEPADQQ